MWCRTVAQPGILFGRRQPPDVRSTVPSVYFRIVEIDLKHQRKILTIVFRQHGACLLGLILASFCATGAEKIKHFVNVYLHCIVSIPKKISNMTSSPALKKILPTPMVGSCSCWQLFGCQVGRCQLTVVLEHLNQLWLMTLLFRLSNFLAYHAFHRYPASAVLLNYAPLQLETIAKCLNQVLLIANETQRWLSLSDLYH